MTWYGSAASGTMSILVLYGTPFYTRLDWRDGWVVHSVSAEVLKRNLSLWDIVTPYTPLGRRLL